MKLTGADMQDETSAADSSAPPYIVQRMPWPVRTVKILTQLQMLLVLASWLFLVLTSLEVSPENGMACDDDTSAFTQVRHRVFCGYLYSHFGDYLQGEASAQRVMPISHPFRLMFLITYETMQSGLLYISVFLLALGQGRLLLYIIALPIMLYFGVEHASVSYTVIGALGALALLHKRSRVYLWPEKREKK